jgi:hypothetical protein
MGKAQPIPEKGELLTCPAMADSHAESPPRGWSWPLLTARDRARGTSRSFVSAPRCMGTCRELISSAQLTVLMLVGRRGEDVKEEHG